MTTMTTKATAYKDKAFCRIVNESKSLSPCAFLTTALLSVNVPKPVLKSTVDSRDKMWTPA